MEYIQGNKITLKPIDEYDTENIIRWRNSFEVKQNLFSQDNVSSEQHINWLNNTVKTGKCHQFIIISNDNSLPVGTVFIKNIDLENKKGEFGIFIGEDIARGKGLGTEATEMIVKYGFINLMLNKIYLSVFANNMPAIKSYRKVGFIQEGYLVKDIYRDNKYYDVIIMAIFCDN